VHLSEPRRLHDDDDDCRWNPGEEHGRDPKGGKDHGNNRDDTVVDVTLDYDLLDNCGASCVLSVDDPRHGTRQDARSPDWRVIDAHHVQFVVDHNRKLRGERYTLKLTCTDEAGNTKVEMATIVLPDHR
jgi:hypothetical protein